ncbi:MAG: NAD-dependent epimerase/dehydratase family protein [Pyrinomonadaceae bacterium]
MHWCFLEVYALTYMNVLVTGGTGYLGSCVRRFFAADDMSRRSDLDILDAHDVVTAQKYDVVIHLAAMLDKSPDNADLIFRTNVQGTANLLREMKKDAVFIFASTKDVYGPFADNYAEVPEDCSTAYLGQSPLEWSKLIAERYVEYYAHMRGFRACIFRMSTVYAPLTTGNTPNFVGYFADCINKGEPLLLPGDGSPRRDLLHVDDLSRACKAFAQSVIGHGLYNLGGGVRNAVTLRELVSKLEEISGLQAVINHNAPSEQPVPLNYISDLRRVNQELGWEPQIDLITGLKTLF